MMVNKQMLLFLTLLNTAKTARYRGVRLNAKQYPPLYQFYATADFRDYTARISADKRGGTLHRPPRHKTHPPLYKTYPKHTRRFVARRPYILRHSNHLL